jgi:hypothetical protein
MLRMTLLELAAFAFPFLMYLLWRNSRWSADYADNDQPAFPIVQVAAAGLVAALLMLTAVVLLGDSTSGDGVYYPPHIEDGQIVPGRFEPADPEEVVPENPDASDEGGPSEEDDSPQ